jgi:hypothetical protein
MPFKKRQREIVFTAPPTTRMSEEYNVLDCNVVWFGHSLTFLGICHLHFRAEEQAKRKETSRSRPQAEHDGSEAFL